MKSSSRVALIAALVFSLFTPSIPVANAEENPFALLLGAQQLIRSFNELVESIQQVGATAEKGYLIDRLVELNHDIYTVELEKRYVVVALQRRPLLQSELKLASDSLGSKIENLRKSLRTLGPKLRIAYRFGTDDCIDLLTEALVTRKAFVYNLGQVREDTAEADVASAKSAIEALNSAQRSLANAIAALQKK